jgi:hypothetical protein
VYLVMDVLKDAELHRSVNELYVQWKGHQYAECFQS